MKMACGAPAFELLSNRKSSISVFSETGFSVKYSQVESEGRLGFQFKELRLKY